MYSGRLNNLQNAVAAFIFAAAFIACILVVCYPGFMSYDSIRMLEEARGQVRGGIYPVMPVYLMRLFDLGGHGPVFMLLAQDFAVLYSVAFFLGLIRCPWFVTPFAMAAMFTLPVILGSMLVVWKDVMTAALMCASLVIMLYARMFPGGNTRAWLKWISLVSLTIGTLVRFNAITATAIIVLYWLGTFYSQWSLRRKACGFLSIIAAIGLLNALISTYSLPDFRKLERNNLAYAIMAYDLIGISKWTGVSHVPFDMANRPSVQKSSIEDINKIYSPLGAVAMQQNNVALGKPVQFFPPGYQPSDAISAWLSGIVTNPLAYLHYRWDLFSEVIGATPFATFEPTHFNKIDDNAFGIKFSDRPITDEALEYIQTQSIATWAKPWPLLLISIVATVVILLVPYFTLEIKLFALFTSITSAMYLLPFFVLTGTGEVRYSYPSLILSSMVIFAMIFGALAPRPTRRSPAITPIT